MSTAQDEKQHRFSFLQRLRSKNDSDSIDTLYHKDDPAGLRTRKGSTHSGRSSVSMMSSTDVADDDDAFSTFTKETLPAYSASPATAVGSGALSAPPAFQTSLQLQVDTLGKSSTSCVFNGQSDPVRVYLVHNNMPLYDEQPALLSLYAKRNSSSCTLVTGPNYGHLLGRRGQLGNDQATVSTTVYRMGPGRPPRIALFSVDQQVREKLPELVVAAAGAEKEKKEKDPDAAGTVAWDSYEVTSKSIFSRTQTLHTRLGNFEWRFATRAERKALSQQLIDEAAAATAATAATPKELSKQHSINSLIILERVIEVHGSMNHGGQSASVGKPYEVRQPVARLIRSRELRTPGSSLYSAGNGGRLQLDLSSWDAVAAEDAKGKVDETVREMAIVMIVTSCILMLKREADLLQGQEAAILANA